MTDPKIKLLSPEPPPGKKRKEFLACLEAGMDPREALGPTFSKIASGIQGFEVETRITPATEQ